MAAIAKPRCSSLDRIFACPGSVLPDGGPKEAGGSDAIMGRAKHEALSYIPQGIDPPVDEIAAKYGVDRDDIALAVHFGRQAWDEKGVYFPSPLIEHRVESSVCRGTLDVGAAVIVDGELTALRVLDWKTGWGTDLHPYQLKGYALGLVEEFGWPENGVVSVFEVWTTHRQTRTTNLTREDLDGFRDELTKILESAFMPILELPPEVAADPEKLEEFKKLIGEIKWYSTGCVLPSGYTLRNAPKLEYLAGPHCTWCPHRPGCETRGRWLREATTALVAVDHGQAITRETIGQAYLKYVEVQRACDRFDRMVKAALDDGPIPLPDGRRVDWIESEREKIWAALALDALRERLTPDEIVELSGDLPKKRLDAWAKANAPRGKKAALLREIYGALREAEAIRTVPHRQRGIVED